MLFNSPTFLWFLVIVYVSFRLLPMGRPRTIFLIIASYVFYMSWNPPFVLLLMFTTILDFNVALGMGRTDNRRKRLALLTVSLVANLGILSFFKYGNFLSANLHALLRGFGVSFESHPLNIILPLGISFYTFQAMSYTIDCYRRTREPTRDLVSYLLYVTFFPELIAGPIVRSHQFLPQVERHQRFTWPALCMGCNLIMMGLVKKMVLADNLAGFVNMVYGDPMSANTAETWAATWAFTAEVYLDFSGYTDIARGVAYLFGYRLPVNFRQPYLAVGFREFWRRWHMTLSSWFRDYLYIPLGGSRVSMPRIYFNVWLTMVIFGLWHGAEWHFVVFGMVHGTYMLIERTLFPKGIPPAEGWRRLPGILVTMTLFALSLTIFRAQSMSDAIIILKHLFVPAGGAVPRWGYELWLPLVITIIGYALVYRRPLDPTLRAYPRWAVPVLYGAAALAIALWGAAGNEFIYFQF